MKRAATRKKSQVIPLDAEDSQFTKVVPTSDAVVGGGGGGSLDQAASVEQAGAVPTAVAVRPTDVQNSPRTTSWVTDESKTSAQQDAAADPPTGSELPGQKTVQEIIETSVEKTNSVMCLISKTVWKWAAIGLAILSLVMLIILIAAFALGGPTTGGVETPSSTTTSTSTTSITTTTSSIFTTTTTEMLDADADGIGDDSDIYIFDADNDADSDGLGTGKDCPSASSDDDTACRSYMYGSGRSNDGFCFEDGMCNYCPCACASEPTCFDICPSDPENDADGDGLCADDDPCPYNADNTVDGLGNCVVQCSPGHYNSQGACDPCPAGTFQPNYTLAATSCANHSTTACAAGYRFNAGTSQTDSSCSQCRTGYYQPFNDSTATSCLTSSTTACGTGQFLVPPSLTADGECVPCPEGS